MVYAANGERVDRTYSYYTNTKTPRKEVLCKVRALLTFAVLFALAGGAKTVFLAFLLARIAAQEFGFFERAA